MSQAAKSRKKAVEYEQLKQFDKAIAAYMRAIEISQAELGDVDVALFNKVGDLTLRQGRVSDAVTYYERAVEHYVTAGLYNNAIALCNKILRSAPGRSTVYFSLGRICARKGLRGDATRNFLEYASRMQHEGRVDEGMRALAEVADLMPELTEVRRLVEEHATRAGITLPQRKVATPSSVAAQNGGAGVDAAGKQDLVFLEIDYSAAAMARMLTPPPMSAVEQAQLPPARSGSHPRPASSNGAKNSEERTDKLTPRSAAARSARLEDLFIFDPTAPGADAAFDDDEESVVDGASLIISTHPSDDEAPSPLTGLETTAVSDEIPDTAANEVASLEEAQGNSLRQTPHAIVAFDDEAMSSTESVLDASFIDLENPGTHRLVAPTPGLVSALEFNLPELPAPDLQGNGVVSPDDDFPEDAVAEETAVEQVDEDDIAALQAEIERSTGGIAAGFSDGATDGIFNDEIVDDTTSDNEIADATNVRHDIELEIESNRELEIAHVDASALSEALQSVDTTVDVSDDMHDIVNRAIEGHDALFANDAGALLDEGDVDEADERDVVENSLHASATVDDVAPEPTHTLDTDVQLRESEIFWLDPEGLDDAPARDVADPSEHVTPESASTIEFLDVDFGAADADDDAPVEEGVVTEALDADIHADIRLDIEMEDETVPVVQDLDITAEELTTSALPWLEMEQTTAPVTDNVAVPLLDGVTFDDEEFAASLPFAASDTEEMEDTAESVFVGELVRNEGLELDVVDASAATETGETVEGFVSDVAAPAANEFSFVGQRTPPFVRTELPARAESLAPPARAKEHDFILPGELPPLMLPDECVQSGLSHVATDAVDDEADVTAKAIDEALTAAAAVFGSPIDPIDAIVAAPSESANHQAFVGLDDLDDLGDLFGSTDVPASVAAAEASVIATSRREELESAVEATPDDWHLRRRLAHALFEVGERDSALTELQAALAGLQGAGDLEAACELADELVLVDGDKVMHHQKRVELAIRLRDDNRLRMAYLDLADMLVRGGDEAPARAVYVRVLEIDPWDDRARLALGDAAPPPPQVAQQDDGYVDLADWLRDDDEPASTRMRMREPSATGNEQADFDSLLRHFKEGVARSLGEEDYESHYDLGVAYKEMGLLDDAVAEFQKALRSRTHRLPAYEALGQCFLEQESYQVAETVLSRALHEPGLGDEQRVGVLYLLGYACEALQRFGEARSYFERVYATDIHFRDVASRLATLDQLAR